MQNLISKIMENKNNWFFKKKRVSFRVLFFLKHFRQTCEIKENMNIFLKIIPKKLNGFFHKIQISWKSFEFSETWKRILENCINRLFCFFRKNDIRICFIFSLKLFSLMWVKSKNRIIFLKFLTEKLNRFLVKTWITRRNLWFLKNVNLTIGIIKNRLFWFWWKWELSYGFFKAG